MEWQSVSVVGDISKRKKNMEWQSVSVVGDILKRKKNQEWQSVSGQLNHDTCSTTLALTSALYFLPY